MGFFSDIGRSIKNGYDRLFHREEADNYEEQDEELLSGRAQRPQAKRTGPSAGTRLFAPIELEEGEEDAEQDAHEDERLFTERVRKRPFILSVLFTTIRFLIIGLALAVIAVAGAGIGIAKAYVETAPVIDRAQLTKSDRTSFLYDKDGKLITSIAKIEYRDWADIDDIPMRLQHAFIAVEDVRFYMHNGVDFKRLFSAALEIFGNRTASGGSTITQQLIKNKILGTTRTYKRKIQEAYLALELEKQIKKPQILEAYLNDINLGESNYGVKTAAMDYFGKELDQITIRECALLASITQNPSYYNLRKNKYERDAHYWEETNARADKVLANMYEAKFITNEEYQAAMKEDVQIIRKSVQKQLYDMPYFVEYAIQDVITHWLAQDGKEDTLTNRSAIENRLRTGGYHIYTTVDTQMQHLVQDTLANWDAYPKLKDPSAGEETEMLADGSVIKTVEPQACAVVVDYHTGQLRALVGGRESPTIRKGLNRVNSYMEVGSSIKPLAVYGPALDMGASPATIIANFPAPIPGWNTERGYPTGGLTNVGPTTMRRGIVSSLNVVAARTLYERVTPEVGARYLTDLGANPAKINVDGSGLALGTSGLTAVQMAAAFGTIADGGLYLEPLSFTKVVDSTGKVVLDAEQVRQKRRVYKESTAYLLIDMLTDAVNSGTGTSAKIKGMTVAGKTGTNSDYRSVYFAGTTPYYAASVWVGHDKPVNVLKNESTGGKYAAPVWQEFMQKIHEGLPNKKIMDVEPAQLGLVKRRICTVSGMLATEACEADQAGHKPVDEWVVEANAPTLPCDMHVLERICSISGQVATEYCPVTTVTSGSVVLIRPGSYFDQFPDEMLLKGIPNYVRTYYTVEEYQQYGNGSPCPLHNAYTAQGGEYSTASNTMGLQWDAAYLRDDILRYIARVTLPTNTYNTLLEHARTLNGILRSKDTALLQATINAAEQAYAGARNAYGE